MKQQITDIASLVFWENVQNESFEITRAMVLNKDFEQLWNIKLVEAYLKRLNIGIDPLNIDDTIKWIYTEVNELIYTFILEERNIEGTVYLDDTIKCRTPDFNKYELLKSLQDIYNDSVRSDLQKFQKIGTLLVRTPLPSVVFTDTKNIPKTFIVADTFKALGFQTNLIFDVDDVTEFPENDYGVKYVISGIFRIHNHNNSDSLWHKIIPNSICYENLAIIKS